MARRWTTRRLGVQTVFLNINMIQISFHKQNISNAFETSMNCVQKG
jgi:hypothetical protein